MWVKSAFLVSYAIIHKMINQVIVSENLSGCILKNINISSFIPDKSYVFLFRPINLDWVS
jgi:hypothetical protein